MCGEVCAKLAAKLTTNRAVLHWEVPFCCFGSVPGRGLSEALYIVKHAAQSSAGLPDGAVFVQLDLSQVFDSLFVNAVLCFLQEHWIAATALSASGVLAAVDLTPRLRFQLFHFAWRCDQRRGTQQAAAIVLRCLVELLQRALNSSRPLGLLLGDALLSGRSVFSLGALVHRWFHPSLSQLVPGSSLAA